MSPLNRRDFLKTTIVAGAAASVGTLPLHAARRNATDVVTLGNSGMKVTRLAFGTGSNNGYVQAALGQKEFSRLIAYAYDRGIRFFETAEAYQTPGMLGEALKPFPRDSYQLMNKVTTDTGVDPLKRFDEMRRISQTEYFDIMLLHWQHTGDWMEETKHWQDGMMAAQSKKSSRLAALLFTDCRPSAGARQQISRSRDDPHEPQWRRAWMGRFPMVRVAETSPR